MKIVIDIPESVIEHIKDGSFGARPDDRYKLITEVLNGTPLPKGHGRLIDADAFIEKYERDKGRQIYADNFIFDLEMNAPTIIEADKEEQ